MKFIHQINTVITTSCLPLSIKRSRTKFSEVMKSNENVEHKSFVFMSSTLPPLISVPTLDGGSILALLNLLFSALG